MDTKTENISEIQLPNKPVSTLFLGYTYEKSKEEYLQELMGRTWGSKNNPIWHLGSESDDFKLDTDTDRLQTIRASLDNLQHKMSKRSYDRASRSFKFRCGEFVDTPIVDINSTYILLELHHSLVTRFQNLKFFGRSHTKGYNESATSINNIYLLLANDGQGILITEMTHNTLNLSDFVNDIHPLQTNLNDYSVSLKSYVPPEYHNPKPIKNWGYLTPFIGQTTMPVEEDALCPLLNFFGWLLFDEWDTPNDQENPDTAQYELYTRLNKTCVTYRMHHVEVDEPDWVNHRDALIFYLGRGTKFERDTFEKYTGEHQFTKTYFRNWDHSWTISKDSIVSLAQHNTQSSYNFVTERFWKGYQILTVQVLIEYLGCMRFTYQMGKIAYKDKDKDKLTHLINQMHQFRLGINLVEFSQRASEATFYSVLRQVFNIRQLIDGLSDEVEDVLKIISMLTQEEEERRREADQIAREKQRAEEQRQREQDEARQKRQEDLLSLLGAITIPFAVISGLMGMNTNMEACGKNGLIPCWHFWDVVGLCTLCVAFVLVIFFGYRHRLNRNATVESK